MPTKTSARADISRPSGPGTSGDNGLTSLGLLMQIGGSVFMGLMLFVAVTGLYAGIFLPKAFDLIIIALLSAGRSAAHLSAGRALVHGTGAIGTQGPLDATRRYIWLAFAQTVVCMVLLHDLAGDMSLVMTMGATWVAWPLTLLVLVRSPDIEAMERSIPRAEDHGFEGASIFMLLFGLVGALFSALVIYQMSRQILHRPGRGFASFESISILVMFGLLLARSVLHFIAGRRGIAGDLTDVRVHSQRYTRFAALSTVIIGGLLFISAGKQGGSFTLVFLVAYLLLAWPRIISRFMDQSDVDMYISGPASRMLRPPDMGLTALGWLLLALSVHGLAGEISQLLWPPPPELGGGLFGMLDTNPLSAQLDSSIWLSIIISLAQFWAAIALVRMNNDYKLAPTVYGLVATALTLYMVWPQLQDAGSSGVFDGFQGIPGIMVLGQIGIALTIPLAALMLVRREPVARAQARYRDDRPDA